MPSSSKGAKYPIVAYLPPAEGPFRCDHCKYFAGPPQSGQMNCKKPEVQADPQVKGVVQPGGCCNLYEKSKNSPVAMLDSAMVGLGKP